MKSEAYVLLVIPGVAPLTGLLISRPVCSAM